MTIAPKARAVLDLQCPNQSLDADSCLSFPRMTLGKGLKMVSQDGAQAQLFGLETTLCLWEPRFPTLVLMGGTYGVGGAAFEALWVFEDSPGPPRWHWMEGESSQLTHV